MIYYSGIGGRILPPNMYKTLYTLGAVFAHMGLCLRSGASDGADLAFEQGCDSVVGGSKEIYLPWRNFNNHKSPLHTVPDEARPVAEELYHSNWDDAKETTKLLMARDCLQVTGITLNVPVDFVVCWTRDGCETREDRTLKTGGTGQAISYANTLDIPVFNLYNKGREDDLLAFVSRYI